MRLKQIAVKFLIFTLLLFVFSCGDECKGLGDEAKFQGVPQMPSDTPDWISDVPKMLSSTLIDSLLGKPIASQTFDFTNSVATIASGSNSALVQFFNGAKDPNRGFIGTRQMIADSKQSANASTNLDTIDISADRERGTVYTMYAGIVRSNEYRATYYLCLILYIVFLGLSYLLGMTELSLQKAIPILVKVGIISLFTNPALSSSTGMPVGWSVYYSTIVSPSIYAMEAFAMHFAAALFEMDIHNINDGFAPIAIMLAFVFNSTFWLKMTTLIASGFPMGFATFIVIMISMCVYIVAGAIAILAYLTIITTLGILFAIGPVFFILLLFEKTAVYFTKWWKQILALMFQQYTLFVSISVFGFIIVKAMQSMLSFDVYCKAIISFKLMIPINLLSIDKTITLLDYPIFHWYASNLGDFGNLTLAMYGVFFFMLTSIFATSIEKIASISEGLIEGTSNVGTAFKNVKLAQNFLNSNANKGVQYASGKALDAGKDIVIKGAAFTYGKIDSFINGKSNPPKSKEDIDSVRGNKTPSQSDMTKIGNPFKQEATPPTNSNAKPETPTQESLNPTAQSATMPEPTPPAPQNTIRDKQEWVGAEKWTYIAEGDKAFYIDPNSTVTYFDPNAIVTTAEGQEMTASQYKSQNGSYDGLVNADGSAYTGTTVSGSEFLQTIIKDGASMNQVISDITQINGQTYDSSHELNVGNLANSLSSSSGNKVGQAVPTSSYNNFPGG